MANVPLVSCILLTTESRRERWFPKAVECFVDQTYPNLELVVAADTPHTSATISNQLGRHVIILCGKWPTLGDKRNAACEAAHGEYICHWDDDDWSEPLRVATQLQRLQESGKAVTGFHDLKFVDDSGKWFKYTGSPSYVLGTSLFYRRDWWEKHHFANTNVGEDALFCSETIRQKRLLAEPDTGLMYATIHLGNTSPRRMPKGNCNWKPLPNFQWNQKAA